MFDKSDYSVLKRKIKGAELSLKRILDNMEMSNTVLKAKGDTTSVSPAGPRKFTVKG